MGKESPCHGSEFIGQKNDLWLRKLFYTGAKALPLHVRINLKNDAIANGMLVQQLMTYLTLKRLYSGQTAREYRTAVQIKGGN